MNHLRRNYRKLIGKKLKALQIQTKFIVLYDNYFPKRKIKLKAKDLKSPWITSGIKKSSKRKQRLYEKLFKKRTEKNELEYKNYKKLLESVKKRSKKATLFQPNS